MIVVAALAPAGYASAVSVFFSTATVNPTAMSTINLAQGTTGQTVYVYVTGSGESVQAEDIRLSITGPSLGTPLFSKAEVSLPGMLFAGASFTYSFNGAATNLSGPPATELPAGVGGFALSPPTLTSTPKMLAEVWIDTTSTAGIWNLNLSSSAGNLDMTDTLSSSIPYTGQNATLDLSAVPEPSTLVGLGAMIASGAPILIWQRRRAARRKAADTKTDEAGA
jgi:hypothetical protein